MAIVPVLMLVVVLMMLAGITGIFQIPGDPLSRYLFHVAGAASHHLNPGLIQNSYCTIAHVSGKHHAHTQICEDCGDIGFASAACRRFNYGFFHDLIVLNGEDCKILTMTKVVIDGLLS